MHLFLVQTDSFEHFKNDLNLLTVDLPRQADFCCLTQLYQRKSDKHSKGKTKYILLYIFSFSI